MLEGFGGAAFVQEEVTILKSLKGAKVQVPHNCTVLIDVRVLLNEVEYTRAPGEKFFANFEPPMFCTDVEDDGSRLPGASCQLMVLKMGVVTDTCLGGKRRKVGDMFVS